MQNGGENNASAINYKSGIGFMIQLKNILHLHICPFQRLHSLMQLAPFWRVTLQHPEELRAVELAVLAAVGWRLQTVTAASVLDTVICLLDYQQSNLPSWYEQMHLLRESSRFLVARALRGEEPLQVWQLPPYYTSHGKFHCSLL